MTGYNGRRAPNVSQYVANLNTIPTPLELDAPEPANYEEDLKLFTNTEFVDWGYDPTQSLGVDRADNAGTKTVDSSTNMDFDLPSDFHFADFSGLPQFADHGVQNLSQNQVNAYPLGTSYTSPVSSTLSPVTPQLDGIAKKRKLDSIDLSAQPPIDEPARVAAEEDKRRRNTAASARFRVKKKQREQALEKTAKEMTDRVSVLEARVQQLETENTWLKSLITEKSSGKMSDEDISRLAKQRTPLKNAGERSTGNRTDGVGTESVDAKAEA